METEYKDRDVFPVLQRRLRPADKRCAARCGGEREPHDIYCQECRDEITGEAWLLIELEEPAHEKA